MMEIFFYALEKKLNAQEMPSGNIFSLSGEYIECLTSLVKLLDLKLIGDKQGMRIMKNLI